MASAPSAFENMVLGALIKGDPEESLLTEQIRLASVESRDYTGVGVFSKFSVPSTVPTLSSSHRYIEQTPRTHLTHPQLAHGAGALLWFEDGVVSTLECYTYEEAWPEDEDSFSVIAAELGR